MTSTAIVPQTDRQITTASAAQEAFTILAYGLTDNSQRQYQHTFTLWRDWCADNGVMAHDVSARHVIAFLESSDIARKTKMARLTHLRRLAQTLHTSDVSNLQFKQNYEQLQLLKLPKGKQTGKPRERRALAPDDVFEALKHWPTNSNLGLRNRAMLGVLLYAGLRRSELVALKWSDIDFAQGLVTVQHGKGDKERTIPFAGDKALDMLKRWRSCIPDYEYVFVPITKGDNAPDDTPISTETVRRVCMASGNFKPHDARRTLITNALASNSSLADVQFIAGHANGATTMGYAIVKDAKEVKGRLKLNY